MDQRSLLGQQVDTTCPHPHGNGGEHFTLALTSRPLSCGGLPVLGWTTTLARLERKCFVRCGNFSAETRTVLGRPGRSVALGLVGKAAPRTGHWNPAQPALACRGASSRSVMRGLQGPGRGAGRGLDSSAHGSLPWARGLGQEETGLTLRAPKGKLGLGAWRCRATVVPGWGQLWAWPAACVDSVPPPVAALPPRCAAGLGLQAGEQVAAPWTGDGG